MNLIWFIIGFICFLICFIKIEYYLIKKTLEAWKDLYISIKELKEMEKEFKKFIDKNANG